MDYWRAHVNAALNPRVPEAMELVLLLILLLLVLVVVVVVVVIIAGAEETRGIGERLGHSP